MSTVKPEKRQRVVVFAAKNKKRISKILELLPYRSNEDLEVVFVPVTDMILNKDAEQSVTFAEFWYQVTKGDFDLPRDRIVYDIITNGFPQGFLEPLWMIFQQHGIWWQETTFSDLAL